MTAMKNVIDYLVAHWALFFLASASITLGTALFFQHVLGYAPCELCYYQRYPYMLVIGISAIAFITRNRHDISLKRAARGFLIIIIALLFLDAAVAFFHIGVEQKWWEGLSTCTASFDAGASSKELLDVILNANAVRCDEPQWTLLGISMAGFNFLIAFGLAIFGVYTYERTK